MEKFLGMRVQPAPKAEAKYGKGGLQRDMRPLLTPVREYVRTRPDIPASVIYRRMAMVPESVLTKYPDLRALLKTVGTAVPKSKRMGKRVMRPPWPMYVERAGEGIYLPRMLALLLFGPSPATTTVFEGLPLNPLITEPAQPLFTVEQCREHNCEPQPLVVDAIVNHLQRNGPFSGAVCCMPPGNGKTACAIHVIFRLGRKALFVVPNLTLIPQVAAEVTKFMGPECRVGTLHTSDPKKQIYKDCDVVVASLASIVECDYAAIMPEFGTVVIDEGHKVCAQDRHTVFNKTAARYVVVLTATPERADHLGGLLEWLAGPIVWFSCTDLTNTRWGRIDVVVHELRYDDKPLVAQYKKMCGERMLDQEFVYDQLATHAGRTGWLAQTIADMAAQGRQVLCLGQRINVMKNLYEHLRRLGVDVGIIVGESNMDSKLTLEERDKVRKCRVRIYTDSIGYQALNVQELDVLFMLDPPVGDINVWIQRIGRITRDYDKDVPTIHLISDTGIVEFEGRIKSVIKKLKAFQETAFHTTHVPHVV